MPLFELGSVPRSAGASLSSLGTGLMRKAHVTQLHGRSGLRISMMTHRPESYASGSMRPDGSSSSSS